MAKTRIFFSAAQAEPTWKPDKNDPAKRVAIITVEAVDGKKYNCYAKEGHPAWDLEKGAELEVEIVDEPQANKYGFAMIPGTSGPGGRGGRGGYVRRGFVKPGTEEATASADYIVQIYVAIKGRMEKTDPHATPEAIATLTAAIFQKTC